MKDEDETKKQFINELVELCSEGEAFKDILSKTFLDAILVVSPGRRIVRCNRSVQRMFGYEGNELIGKKTDMLYADRRSDPATGRREIHDVLEKEGCHIGLAKGRTKSGKNISLEIISGKLRNCQGVVLLLRDITEYKRVEDELKKQRDVLEKKAESFERELGEKIQERIAELENTHEALKKLNEVKDELLSSVSHEFRTPLASIISFSEILLNYPDNPEETQREFLSADRIRDPVCSSDTGRS